MYRSSEIIQLFYYMNLPKEITKHILRIERDILFHKSLNEWIYLDSESRKYKFKRFFYDENHHLFINEIFDINGSFLKLNDAVIIIGTNNGTDCPKNSSITISSGSFFLK